ncbi:MAG: oxidoreductase, partial [Actinomycetes bacterium]
MPSSDPLAHVAVLPGVADAVERARLAIDQLRGHRALRRYAERVATESALRGAWASAVLDGADLTMADLRVSVTGERGRPPPDPLVQGSVRVAAELGQLRAMWSPAPLQV